MKAPSELDVQVADLLGVDRRVPRSRAECAIGEEASGICGGAVWGPLWWRGFRIEEIPVPPGSDLPPVDGEGKGGRHPYNARCFAHVGRLLGERFPEAREAIENSKEPPLPYSSSWDVFMREVRPWLLRMPDGGAGFWAALDLSTCSVEAACRVLVARGWECRVPLRG